MSDWCLVHCATLYVYCSVMTPSCLNMLFPLLLPTVSIADGQVSAILKPKGGPVGQCSGYRNTLALTYISEGPQYWICNSLSASTFAIRKN